ncbi:hypothetical protein FHS13_000655 [Nocardiopsis algeriensis]|uniref:Uncharacterized protein n=1 Tax=Nocardiopsis algeriensis TaxID=1478215 RepID=A0A841IJ75_9ACTN|nr:hypothetical protein [Nocardiopsis algeriensis]
MEAVNSRRSPTVAERTAVHDVSGTRPAAATLPVAACS